MVRLASYTLFPVLSYQDDYLVSSFTTQFLLGQVLKLMSLSVEIG